jgi:hypothetical protein
MLEILRAERADDAWVRGARSVCEMYAETDASRFHVILQQLARGSPSSGLAEGARWLLPRWLATQQQR